MDDCCLIRVSDAEKDWYGDENYVGSQHSDEVKDSAKSQHSIR